ncbi:hypothetical protein NQ314_000865 [Rhamnusium bicolor]|uniref:Uncharacterized protein n=1 Tax=Rhamnusium bicolor TaxID=1586634 RepID=A0AAV8ZTT4_9CUCU|nr:hypothetical protein NQ314_000865 [Rhamnusium bicolor]
MSKKTGGNTTNVMSRALNYKFLRRLTTYFQSRKNNVCLPVNNIKTYISKGGKLFVSSQIFSSGLKNESITKIDVEDGLRKACEEGDAAVIKLLDQLKEFVIIVSQEYRCCMIKQIEITQTASNVGPFSEVWDELPRYRTLADELNKELIEYMTLFKTIGQMAQEESLARFVTGSSGNLQSVSVKYNELEVLLQREFEENKKFEVELLRIKRDSILKSFVK